VQLGKNAVPSSSSGPSSSEALRIPSILRRSWLSPKPRSATPTTSSTKLSLLSRQLTDNELEGRSLNAQMREEMGYREGARPVSGASVVRTGSARSGNTRRTITGGRSVHPCTPSPSRFDIYWQGWSRCIFPFLTNWRGISILLFRVPRRHSGLCLPLRRFLLLLRLALPSQIHTCSVIRQPHHRTLAAVSISTWRKRRLQPLAGTRGRWLRDYQPCMSDERHLAS
jgi:hypothetical protein